jgi:hypothetical protein
MKQATNKAPTPKMSKEQFNETYDAKIRELLCDLKKSQATCSDAIMYALDLHGPGAKIQLGFHLLDLVLSNTISRVRVGKGNAKVAYYGFDPKADKVIRERPKYERMVGKLLDTLMKKPSEAISIRGAMKITGQSNSSCYGFLQRLIKAGTLVESHRGPRREIWVKLNGVDMVEIKPAVLASQPTPTEIFARHTEAMTSFNDELDNMTLKQIRERLAAANSKVLALKAELEKACAEVKRIESVFNQ